MRLPGLALIFAALVLAACSGGDEPSTAEKADPAVPLGKGFDFYVLALSWSPGYCTSEGDKADPRQCGDGRRYEFVVHGLWPQFEKGYPANCESVHGKRIDNKLAGSIIDIMPSFGLIRHQWRKHGRCSGLSPERYFDVTRAAFNKIALPAAFSGLDEPKTVTHQTVEKLFQAENKSIPPDGIAVTCKGNYLRDVRICLTKDLEFFRPCPEVDRNHCRRPTMAVVPSR